jgi:hypothetical protein
MHDAGPETQVMSDETRDALGKLLASTFTFPLSWRLYRRRRNPC